MKPLELFSKPTTGSERPKNYTKLFNYMGVFIAPVVPFIQVEQAKIKSQLEQEAFASEVNSAEIMHVQGDPNVFELGLFDVLNTPEKNQEMREVKTLTPFALTETENKALRAELPKANQEDKIAILTYKFDLNLIAGKTSYSPVDGQSLPPFEAGSEADKMFKEVMAQVAAAKEDGGSTQQELLTLQFVFSTDVDGNPVVSVLIDAGSLYDPFGGYVLEESALWTGKTGNKVEAVVVNGYEVAVALDKLGIEYAVAGDQPALALIDSETGELIGITSSSGGVDSFTNFYTVGMSVKSTQALSIYATPTPVKSNEIATVPGRTAQGSGSVEPVGSAAVQDLLVSNTALFEVGGKQVDLIFDKDTGTVQFKKGFDTYVLVSDENGTVGWANLGYLAVELNTYQIMILPIEQFAPGGGNQVEQPTTPTASNEVGPSVLKLLLDIQEGDLHFVGGGNGIYYFETDSFREYMPGRNNEHMTNTAEWQRRRDVYVSLLVEYFSGEIIEPAQIAGNLEYINELLATEINADKYGAKTIGEVLVGYEGADTIGENGGQLISIADLVHGDWKIVALGGNFVGKNNYDGSYTTNDVTGLRSEVIINPKDKKSIVIAVHNPISEIGDETQIGNYDLTSGEVAQADDAFYAILNPVGNPDLTPLLTMEDSFYIYDLE